MSDGVVLDAIYENRGTIVPGYDADKKPFPAWTAYFECGEMAAYHQCDLRLLRNGQDLVIRQRIREFLGHFGFEAREEDLSLPIFHPLALLRAEGIATGEIVQVPWEHHGDVAPGYDENQIPYPAVSSYFEIGEKAVYCWTDKRMALGRGVDPAALHKQECIALLASHGLRVTAEAFA